LQKFFCETNESFIEYIIFDGRFWRLLWGLDLVKFLSFIRLKRLNGEICNLKLNMVIGVSVDSLKFYSRKMHLLNEEEPCLVVGFVIRILFFRKNIIHLDLIFHSIVFTLKA